MESLLGALLALGALVVVIWPFLRRERGASNPASNPSASMAEMRQLREVIYQEMRTLQTEYAVAQAEPESAMKA